MCGAASSFLHSPWTIQQTHCKTHNSTTTAQVYAAIRDELAAGGRVYIVCPLVSATAANNSRANSSSAGDSSDGEGATSTSSSSSDPKRTVMDEYARLTQAGVFGEQHKVGLLHGRLSGDEKARALKDFSR